MDSLPSFVESARDYVSRFLPSFEHIDASASNGATRLRFRRDVSDRVFEQLIVEGTDGGTFGVHALACVRIVRPYDGLTELECDSLLELELDGPPPPALASLIERAFDEVRPAYPTLVALCDFGLAGAKPAAA